MALVGRPVTLLCALCRLQPPPHTVQQLAFKCAALSSRPNGGIGHFGSRSQQRGISPACSCVGLFPNGLAMKTQYELEREARIEENKRKIMVGGA